MARVGRPEVCKLYPVSICTIPLPLPAHHGNITKVAITKETRNMDIAKAGELARQQMQAHGLTDWRFTVDFAKRRFGQCRHRTKEISLSIPLVKLNTEEKVLDTILHEIAHALAGPRAGHGRIWKAKAAAIGANPKRCYGDEVIAPPKVWKGTCPAGHTIERDRIRNGLACGKCCGGKYDPAHKFVWTRNK